MFSTCTSPNLFSVPNNSTSLFDNIPSFLTQSACKASIDVAASSACITSVSFFIFAADFLTFFFLSVSFTSGPCFSGNSMSSMCL
ncbi:hypothetical protein Hanom_Chr08g00684321 [Helianthus anomalus]